jgi:serine protease
MSRLRQRVVFLTVCLAVLALPGLRGQTQRALFGVPVPPSKTARPARVLVDRFGPRAIEGGISPIEARAPGSPEELQRRSLRPAAGARDRAGRSGAAYVPGRVIVKFKDGASDGARLSALSAVSRTAALSPRPAYANFDLVRIDAGDDAEAVAQAFSARADVEYAQPAYRMHTEFVPNDAFYAQGLQWNLKLIGLERAWDIQPQAGSNITVAVVDTGVAYTSATMRFHASAFRVDSDGLTEPPGGSGTLYPALGDLTLSFVAATELGPSTRFVAPHDFIWDDATPLDLDGHGTHVSGTLGQLTNNGSNGQGDARNGGGTAGVAFNVKIMPVKVLDSDWDDIFGSPNQGTDDVVARGVRYAADNGAKVINLSLGRTGPPSPVMEDAIRFAVGKGAFIAIAAGNDFEDGNPDEVLPEIALKVPGAVTVGAVDRNKGHATYSSTGAYVELAAPGGDFGSFGAEGGILQQTLNLDLVDTFQLPVAQFTAPRFDALAYFFFIGTSQATPHVSGVAAMLMQQGITDPAAVEAALEQMATPCSESQRTCNTSVTANRNSTYGFGLIDARSALRGLGLAR